MERSSASALASVRGGLVTSVMLVARRDTSAIARRGSAAAAAAAAAVPTKARRVKLESDIGCSGGRNGA
jgi:hypothetical protein